jgi:hypothetical protein
MALSQFHGHAPLGVEALPAFGRFVRNHFVAKTFTPIESGHPGARQNADVRRGITLTERLQGGQGHNGVAYPVRCANQNFLYFSLLQTGARTLRIPF